MGNGKNRAFDQSKWPNWIDPAEVIPYDKNAKLHDERQVRNVANSIRRFGWQQDTVITRDKVLVIGHCRRLAALQLGCMLPYHIIDKDADELTEEDIKELRFADNLTNESPWDYALGALDMADLSFEGFEFDLSEFVADEEETVEDDYSPAVPDDPKARLGDIYLLGNHRLMCGDSTRMDDVARLVDGEQIDMLLTDPPYNVDYNGTAGKIKNDNMDSDSFRLFLRNAFANAKAVLKPGGVFHIWYGESEAYNFRGACAEAGISVRQQLVWVKSKATIGRQDFQHQYESVLAGDSFDDSDMEERGYEPMLYGWTDGSGHKWYKKRKERDVLFFDKPTASKEHPTMKPVLLFDYEMKCNTRPGDAVMDLFGGSGTTIIAAEQNGRRAFVMEYDPKFVDVIIDRWEKFTGEKAVLLNG
ncbi:MAG: DNA modification methylase [Bacteroidales bacterium]|nr:DNA modification methylase [Bacteroidales bacterium]